VTPLSSSSLGKYTTVNQINSSITQIMNFLLGVHLSVCGEMAFGFSGRFAFRKAFIADLPCVNLLKRVTQGYAEKTECHAGLPIFLGSYPDYESKESKTHPSSLSEGWR